MKPYQVHLFPEEKRTPGFPPSDPIFVHENMRYLNFLNFDCLYLKNNEYLQETAKSSIASNGIGSIHTRAELLNNLQKIMSEIKRVDSLLLFPDEISALFAIFSICGPQTTYFIDYETSPSIIAVLQHRNVEYYNHQDLDQLNNLLGSGKGKVMVIDGVYEWFGNISPVNDLVKIAKDNECIIVANEINSFGLVGREGRGFIDFFNVYDEVNIEIGSFNKFLGGFGCYIGAKNYLINKIKENTAHLTESLPQFMLAVNCAGLELIKQGKTAKGVSEKLWKNSRYFISRIRQLGLKTISDIPIIVISFNNNEEAQEFRGKLFLEQIMVAQNKERIRLCLSVEHSQKDLDYCLGKFESIGKELGIIN